MSGEDTYKGGKKSPPPSCGILKGGGEISPTLLSKLEGGKKSPPRENSPPRVPSWPRKRGDVQSSKRGYLGGNSEQLYTFLGKCSTCREVFSGQPPIALLSSSSLNIDRSDRRHGHNNQCYTRFREVYYWDSYWTIKGLLLCNMFQTSRFFSL